MARGAAIMKPGQQRNKVKWKGAAPAQRVLDREKHDKRERGAAIIKPDHQRSKVKWKDAAPARRVPGRENTISKRIRRNSRGCPSISKWNVTTMIRERVC